MANITGKKYGGRKKGTPNKLTKETKELLKNIVHNELELIPNSLNNLDTLDRLEILIKLLPYVIPKIEVKNNQINIGALPVSRMSNQATSEINKILEMEY